MIRLRIRRILPRSYIGAESLSRMSNQSRSIAVVPHKLSRSVEGQIQQVMENQNLPITLGPSANPNRGSTNLRCNQSSHFSRNAIKHYASHASPVQSHT